MPRFNSRPISFPETPGGDTTHMTDRSIGKPEVPLNTTGHNDSITQADDVLIPLTKVRKACGFSKTSIYRMMNRGTFPKPAKRAGRSVRWRNSEVQQWVRNEWPAQAPA